VKRKNPGSVKICFDASRRKYETPLASYIERIFAFSTEKIREERERERERVRESEIEG
jgi:hypothetical protein